MPLDAWTVPDIQASNSLPGTRGKAQRLIRFNFDESAPPLDDTITLTLQFQDDRQGVVARSNTYFIDNDYLNIKTCKDKKGLYDAMLGVRNSVRANVKVRNINVVVKDANGSLVELFVTPLHDVQKCIGRVRDCSFKADQRYKHWVAVFVLMLPATEFLIASDANGAWEDLPANFNPNWCLWRESPNPKDKLSKINTFKKYGMFKGKRYSSELHINTVTPPDMNAMLKEFFDEFETEKESSNEILVCEVLPCSDTVYQSYDKGKFVHSHMKAKYANKLYKFVMCFVNMDTGDCKYCNAERDGVSWANDGKDTMSDILKGYSGDTNGCYGFNIYYPYMAQVGTVPKVIKEGIYRLRFVDYKDCLQKES